MALQTLKYLLLMGTALSAPAGAVLLATPPMGFNDWSALMCGLNESVFVDAAQAMVKTGLLAAGYNRINLDDCWSTMSRTANGSMQWDPVKFPRGLPWLTDYLKSLGFSPGIYTDAGTLSCGGFPGAYGHEELDAKTFASWGFEYLKLDGCNMPTGTEQEYKTVYGNWHKILSSMDPPLVFSESAPAYFAEADNLTDWYSVMDWVPKFGQLARHSRDTLVFNSTGYWPYITGWDSVMFNYGQEVRLARYQKPGYFNDPDFLIPDHFDFTLDEKKSHFAIWASLSAPLIISSIIPNLTSEEIAFLTNKDLIAVNQDPLALQATLVSQDGTWDVLTKSLANGDRLLTVINRGNQTATLNVPFSRIGLPSQTKNVQVKDLWTKSSSHASKQVIAANVPSHGTAVLRISTTGSNVDYIPTGMIFNTYSLTTLTLSKSGIQWANSTGEDGQVWHVQTDGTLRSLLDISKCLTDVGGGKVTASRCDGEKTQRWQYYYGGNLKNHDGAKCLNEGINGTATLEKCLYEDNTQVLALPSGVNILED